MMQQEKVRVLWNKKVGPYYYHIGVTCNDSYRDAIPGQFVMVYFRDQAGPFLPRPFSIHRLITERQRTLGIELLCKVVGAGTSKLAACQPGETLNVLGPLGKGFSFSEHYRRIFLVAGGIGVAPMPFLASFLQSKGVDASDCSIFLGGRATEDLLCRDDFLQSGMNLHLTTDDGSAGEQCLVTHPLEIAANKLRPDIIYACGPMAMLACVVDIANKFNIPCQASIEAMMACGMGACLGCAVPKGDALGGYMHACIDGPVFDANNLNLTT